MTTSLSRDLSGPHTGDRRQFLRPGDRVGVAAPAGVVASEAIIPGLMALRDMGLEPVLADGLFEVHRTQAGTEAHRLGQLIDLLERPDIPAIVCARGGYGCLRLLPGLTEWLARCSWPPPPKILMGFSDITALFAGLNDYPGLRRIHGPMLTTLGSGGPSVTAAVRRLLFGQGPVILEASKAPQPDGSSRPVVIHPGCGAEQVWGTVIGGNLATFCHLLGTPFFPHCPGAILVLEDVAEPSYKIDRMFTQLRLAGVFEDLAALVLGTFTDCGPPEVIRDIVTEAVVNQSGEARFPVLAGFPVGHGAVNLPFPLGVFTRLDIAAGRLIFEEESVPEDHDNEDRFAGAPSQDERS